MALHVGSCTRDFTEDDFDTTTQAEADAKERIQFWVRQAETLLTDPGIPEEHRDRLEGAIERTRHALSRYDDLRFRGQSRTMIIAPITTSAGAIVADDATVVGAADDVLLIPLALAAIATYAITDPAASEQELTQAWNATLDQVGALGVVVQSTLSFASAGNVADTGIMAEVHEMIRAANREPTPEEICRALATLMQAAKDAGDTRRENRIRATQKSRGCRHSRHDG
ncbi:polymorphic toxin type 34 domain-containing protein [Haliangium sp.]|uniref:polymorphic toxin type 34 domain-containing protein n=1 Tax=Haliangium sp. TaxID=2663208 RepID=UPI003D11948E